MSKRLSIMKQPVFSVINDHLVDYPSPSNIKCAVVVTISLLGYQATYEKRLTCIGRPKAKGCQGNRARPAPPRAERFACELKGGGYAGLSRQAVIPGTATPSVPGSLAQQAN